MQGSGESSPSLGIQFGSGMRHVGIVGHSMEGAALCFRALCHAGFQALGPNQHPRVSLDCIAVGHSIDAWEASDYAAVRRVLADSIQALARAGADFFICPDNTSHLALELPGEELALPGLHIAEVVADAAAARAFTRVAILGTRHTMDGPIYPRVLAARGIDARAPDDEYRPAIDRVIHDELVHGIVSDASRDVYVDVIERLEQSGCDAVALVCTEIPMLISDETSPIPTLDSTTLLAQAGVDVAIGRRAFPTWRGGPASDG